jgi:hypothetical protein
MSQLDLDADDPFEVLGVSRTKPLHEIQERTQELVTQYDADDAIAAIGDAFDEIRNGPHVTVTDGTRIEPLIVEVEKDTVSVNQSVSVTVTDITHSAVEDAELKVNGEWKEHTGPNGGGTVQLSDPGQCKIIARRNASENNREYRNGEAEVTVEKLHETLSFDECPDTASIGKEIQVRIVDSNQNGVQDAQVTGSHIETDGSTGADGWITVSPTAVGPSVELHAEKENTSNRKYSSASYHIDVAEREIALKFADPASEVTYNKSTEFRIIDEDGTGVSGATLSTSAETTTTDTEGYGTLQFDDVTLGTMTVEADKDGGDGVRFEPVTTDITVTAKSIQLDIELLHESVTADESATFAVTDEDGIPVESAYVSGTDGGNDRTDATGRAQIRFDKSGQKTVSASKHDRRDVREYEGDNIEVTVERQSKQLEFYQIPSNITVGETVTVGVRCLDDQPQSSAKVNAEDGTRGQTGDDGTAYIRFAEAGTKELSVTKPPTDTTQYSSATKMVTIERKERDLKFSRCPDTAVAGEKIEFCVEDERGPVENANVKLSDGTSATTRSDGTAELTPSGNDNISVTASKSPTAATVYNDAQSSLQVSERDINLHFDKAPTTARYGTTELFRVIDDDGIGVHGVEISIPGQSATTDQHGYATLPFDSVSLGTVTVEAMDPYQSSTGSSTTIKIEVEKNHIELSLNVIDATAVGRPVTFEVTDRHGDPVEAATIQALDDSTEVSTDENGQGELRFNDPGKQAVRAKKDGGSGVEYKADTIEIEIQRRRVYLSMETTQDDIHVGDPLEVIVTDSDGTTIDDAIVNAEDGIRTQTDAQGRANVTFHSDGQKRLEVSKSSESGVEYRPTYEEIEVR